MSREERIRQLVADLRVASYQEGCAATCLGTPGLTIEEADEWRQQMRQARSEADRLVELIRAGLREGLW